MASQKIIHLSLRRLAAASPSTFSITSSLAKFSSPAGIAAARNVQYRPAATATPAVTEETDPNSILAKQRRNRPVSPHLSIYRPQIPWVLSGLNRITGSLLSSGFYIFGAAYLVAPLFGWHLESASIAAAFGAWPVPAKIFTKMLIAMPFTFHSFNGVRHLMWDTGAGLSNQKVIITGWTVVGLATVSALGLALM